MKKRVRVFVQVQNQRTGRWHNVVAAENYDSAVALMREEQEKYPKARFRVLKPNLHSHTK